MSERILRGIAASPGIGAGPAHLLDPRPGEDDSCVVALSERPAASEAAEGALDEAATQVAAVAERLKSEGRENEAEIVSTGAMLAADPALRDAVRARILDEGQNAAGAIVDAADALADRLAGLDDPMLAARADDVRSVGRRAGLIAAGGGRGMGPEGGWPAGILVASDLGPADVAELGSQVSGVALARGAVTAHAAIVARSLGIPMVVGVGEEVLAIAEDDPTVVDGSEGEFVLSPSHARAAQARLAGQARQRSRDAAASRRELPAVTTDGRVLRVLANVAGAAEVRMALEAGAEGIGLLRTELSFLDARRWPDRGDHERILRPALGALGDRVATVRVLDFGGDKSPPFLRGREERGIALLLQAPEALDAQLQAMLAAAGECDLRVLLPMVESADQVRSARQALACAVEAVPGSRQPEVGAMVETAEAIERLDLIAEQSDFLSIGTNDLSASILGRDRFGDGGVSARDPAVLRAIEVVAHAGEEGDLPVELCGEAASDPSLLPILIGLGVDELSVGAARVGEVRAWVRAVSLLDCRALAHRSLRAKSEAEVEALTADVAGQLGSAEFRDAAGERLNGAGSVVSLGSDN
jgi:phosphoenolpyruvate-protein kinase (PTS system EI component)